MKCKDCKIICDGIEIAKINCKDGEFSIKYTNEGKQMCKELCKGCC